MPGLTPKSQIEKSDAPSSENWTLEDYRNTLLHLEEIYGPENFQASESGIW